MSKSVHFNWQNRLDRGLSEIGITLDDVQKGALIEYLLLLERWNRAYNLTAVHDFDQMIERLVIDSLTILPLIKGKQVLDVGTGPGLPGIPLAIVCPYMAFTLLDANRKKTRFVQQAKAELGLSQVTVVWERAEKYRPKRQFDTITSRALTSLPTMVDWTAHLLAEEGHWLAMKGEVPKEELDVLKERGLLVEPHRLQAPAALGLRHGILIKRACG